MELIRPQTYTATVSSVTRLAGEFYLGAFALVDPTEIQFLAGQYVIFQIGPPKLRHTMSIASPPSKRREIEILQQRVPGGEGSKWFAGLKRGDRVQWVGPLGKFVLSGQTPPHPKVFVATGSGIAPIRSMIRDYLETGGTARVTLWWGLRHETDLFWQEELAALAEKHANFHYTMTLSKPTDAWTGKRGRVTEHGIGETPDLAESEFYLCGNRHMIVDMRGILTDNGVPGEQIFTETFF